MTNWKGLSLRNANLFKNEGKDYNFPLIENAKTISEFDDGLTRGTLIHPLDIISTFVH